MSLKSICQALQWLVPPASKVYEKGSLFISVDALFGCVHKCSAGTSGKSSNHGEELFISQEKVATFLANYSKRPSSKSTITSALTEISRKGAREVEDLELNVLCCRSNVISLELVPISVLRTNPQSCIDGPLW